MFLLNNAITSGSYASVLTAQHAFPHFQARTTSSILRKYSLLIPSYHFDTGQMKNLQKSKNNIKTVFHTGVAASAIIAVVLIAGCSTQLISRGNMPEKRIVDSIRVGINNRAQVLAIAWVSVCPSDVRPRNLVICGNKDPKNTLLFERRDS